MVAAACNRAQKETVMTLRITSHPTALRLAGASLSAMVVAMVATAAMAHAFPESSDPAPGENLQTAPSEVAITFDDEVDPDGSSFEVKSEGGQVVGRGEVDLTVADRNVLRGDVDISAPGLYTVNWTALSIDGDSTHGSFTFGFQSSGPVPSDAPQEENPDTALPFGRSTSTPLLIGMLLIGLAALLAVEGIERDRR